MNTLKTKLLMAVVLSLMFVGCSSDNVAVPHYVIPTTNDKPFTFLKVGNKWEYAKYNEQLQYAGYFTQKIVSENAGYYKLEYDNGNQEYWYDGDECWKVKMYYSTIGGEIQLYKNCYVEQKWSNYYMSGGYGFEDRIEVISVSEVVSTFAGTFTNCIQLQVETYIEGDQFCHIECYWLHKNIGLIKSKNYRGITTVLHKKNF